MSRQGGPHGLLCRLSARGGQWERGLGVLPDDFRRTVAASILKWVVHHQNYCNKAKSKSKKEEVKNGDPSPKKGTQRRGAGPRGPMGCGVSGQREKVFSW